MSSVSRHTASAAVSMRSDAPGRPPAVWGSDVVMLHDRYWASLGIEVIRCGSGVSPSRGPGLYLLMEGDNGVDLRITPILRRLHWNKPRAIRLRISDRRAPGSRERIITDRDGNFLHIVREYSPSAFVPHRLWITPERGLAAVWAAAPSGKEGLATLRSVVRPTQRESLRIDGAWFDLGGDDVDEWVASALPLWERVSSVFDGVYQHEPGVWAHESSRIHPSTVFAGPVLVGAGVIVPEGSAVVGPTLLPDALPAVPPRPVQWDLVFSPRWSGLHTRAKRSARMVSKRLFDIVFSIVVLALTVPIYPLVMLAIFIEDGTPFFFAHQRETFGGRPFGCWKFRTMVNNAEAMKAQLQHANRCDGPQFFIEDDPRLLKVGRLMRTLQIDELPQFWNVLFGHMSVVGPRPSPSKENQFCPAWREARLSVRPGITGLWQVRRTREPETDFQEWIRYDLEYVQNHSLRLDLWIIFQTIGGILRALRRSK